MEVWAQSQVWDHGGLGQGMFVPMDVWAQDFIRLNYVTNDSYRICGYRMPLLIKTPSQLERHFLAFLPRFWQKLEYNATLEVPKIKRTVSFALDKVINGSSEVS